MTLASLRSFEALAARAAVYRAHEHQINALYWQLVQIVAPQAFEFRHALADVALARTVREIETSDQFLTEAQADFTDLEDKAIHHTQAVLREWIDPVQKQNRKAFILNHLGKVEANQRHRRAELKEHLREFFSSAHRLNPNRWTTQTIERLGFALLDGELAAEATAEAVVAFALEIAAHFLAISKSVEKNQFDSLLTRLHADRQLAGEEYEKLRDRLIYFFEARQWHGSETGQFIDVSRAADETLNRVAEKVHQEDECAAGQDTRIQNVRAYTLGVAKLVWMELHTQATQSIQEPAPLLAPSPNMVRILQTQCLMSLKEEHRKLILRYCGCKVLDDQNAAEYRRQLIEEFGFKDAKALQQSVSYIRSKLEKCVEHRLRLAHRSPFETGSDELREGGDLDDWLEI
ncbi:MAG: hypothetical protein HY774_26490 [Acidobacteria bacterium]|nr:hypothetical protein [Acidobacteriota bacterium]